MKKIFITLALSALLFACAVPGPEVAVKNFTENFSKGEWTEAKKFCSEEIKQEINRLIEADLAVPDSNFVFTLLKDSIEGKEAWVTFSDQNNKETTMKVVKIDGKWLASKDSNK